MTSESLQVEGYVSSREDFEQFIRVEERVLSQTDVGSGGAVRCRVIPLWVDSPVVLGRWNLRRNVRPVGFSGRHYSRVDTVDRPGLGDDDLGEKGEASGKI